MYVLVFVSVHFIWNFKEVFVNQEANLLISLGSFLFLVVTLFLVVVVRSSLFLVLTVRYLHVLVVTVRSTLFLVLMVRHLHVLVVTVGSSLFLVLMVRSFPFLVVTVTSSVTVMSYVFLNRKHSRNSGVVIMFL